MAVIGYEVIIALVVVLVIFLWGPRKIPELARSFGRVRRDFEQAQQGLEASLDPRKEENRQN